MQKQHIKDFFCAAAIFSIILLSLVLVSGQDFFENAIYFNKEALSFTFFDTKITLDKSVLTLFSHLRRFYGAIIGKNLVSFLESRVLFCTEYVNLLFGLLYRLACIITQVSF